LFDYNYVVLAAFEFLSVILLKSRTFDKTSNKFKFYKNLPNNFNWWWFR